MMTENQDCLEGAARAMECLMPKELLDEAWKTPRRLHNLIRLINGELLPSLAQTPCDEIARWGRVRLLRYKVPTARRQCPVLMVPSIINRHYVLDLRPGESLVEYLVQQGIPVYMLDWGRPGPQDRYATLEDHILRWQGAAVREACKDAGVSAVHMLGYCLGGTFVAAYAALRPRRVAGVLALTAPINFHDDSLLSVWARSDVWNIEQLVSEFGLIPSELLQASFQQLNPVAQFQKLRVFVENLWNDGFVERFLAMETWLNDNVDFPGATYIRHINDLYRGNKLMKGELTLGTETVRLESITCPVLTAVASKDHICPAASAALLHHTVASADRTLLELEGGHIGVTVGRGARAGLWKAAGEWLLARPCPPRG